MGRDSSVGIATRYGLDGPGIEYRWGGEIFRIRPDRPRGPTQSPIQCVPCLSRGVKRPGRGVDHPLPSSAEVKERVELYLYSPSVRSWPVLERPLLYKCLCKVILEFGTPMLLVHPLIPWSRFIPEKPEVPLFS